jgi:hypothetical protein
VEKFLRLEVPLLEDLDRLPIWLCHGIEMVSPTLPSTVEVMLEVGDRLPETKPWELWSVFRVPLFYPMKLERNPGPLRRVRRALDGGRTSRQAAAFAERYVGTGERLQELEELDQQLQGARIAPSHESRDLPRVDTLGGSRGPR